MNKKWYNHEVSWVDLGLGFGLGFICGACYVIATWD